MRHAPAVAAIAADRISAVVVTVAAIVAVVDAGVAVADAIAVDALKAQP
jgi:hypothetical protein